MWTLCYFFLSGRFLLPGSGSGSVRRLMQIQDPVYNVCRSTSLLFLTFTVPVVTRFFFTKTPIQVCRFFFMRIKKCFNEKCKLNKVKINCTELKLRDIQYSDFCVDGMGFSVQLTSLDYSVWRFFEDGMGFSVQPSFLDYSVFTSPLWQLQGTTP